MQIREAIEFSNEGSSIFSTLLITKSTISKQYLPNYNHLLYDVGKKERQVIAVVFEILLFGLKIKHFPNSHRSRKNSRRGIINIDETGRSMALETDKSKSEPVFPRSSIK